MSKTMHTVRYYGGGDREPPPEDQLKQLLVGKEFMSEEHLEKLHRESDYRTLFSSYEIRRMLDEIDSLREVLKGLAVAFGVQLPIAGAEVTRE